MHWLDLSRAYLALCEKRESCEDWLQISALGLPHYPGSVERELAELKVVDRHFRGLANQFIVAKNGEQ